MARTSQGGMGEKNLPKGWISLPSKTYPGKIYFFNTENKSSTWKNPLKATEESGNAKARSPSSGFENEKKLTNKRIKSAQKKKKRKSNENTISQEPDQKTAHIEDYDEQQDQFFDNVPVKLSLTHSSAFESHAEKDSSFCHTNDFKHNDSNTSFGSNLKNHPHICSNERDKELSLNNCAKFTFHEYQKIGDQGSSRFSKTSEVLGKNERKKMFSRDSDKKNKVAERKKARKGESVKSKKFDEMPVEHLDKTPNQTRLLKFRIKSKKLAEEALEKFAAYKIPKKKDDNSLSHISFDQNKKQAQIYLFNAEPKHNKCIDDRDKSSESVSHAWSTSNDYKNDGLKVEPEINQNIAFNSFNETYQGKSEEKQQLELDNGFSEEMDWEPTNEELDARNINEFCLEIDIIKNVDIFDNFGLDSDQLMSLPYQSNPTIFILDTNIYVSCLNFVRILAERNLPVLGYTVLYVPWRVLQELDHLKSNSISSVNRQLSTNARKAISFLNENFKNGNSKFYGQSYQDFLKVNEKTSSPDDEILLTCVQLKIEHNNEKVILITNDKNLESKAFICNIEAYSKENFQNKYLTNSSEIENSFSVNNAGFEIKKYRNDIFNELKDILSKFLSEVLETEMKAAFDSDWSKICYVKPPWTFEDILVCLDKHWRSVFFLIFSRETHDSLDVLHEEIRRREKGSNGSVDGILFAAHDLINNMKSSKQQNEKPYLMAVDSVLNKISQLKEKINLKYSSRGNNDQIASSDFPCTSAISATPSVVQRSLQSGSSSQDFMMAKDLFRNIWDSLKNFCDNLSESMNSGIVNTNLSEPEARLKLLEKHRKVANLIWHLERIFEVNVQDVTESHVAIAQLSDFLCLFLPLERNFVTKLPKCLSVFFCDSEGRLLLYRSLNDFREFSMTLLKASEYVSRFGI